MLKTILASLVLATTIVATNAGELPKPAGPVILTVGGHISHTNSPDGAQFDLAMLDALTQRDTTTKTPWFEGEETFSGPLISAILDAVGASGSTLTVSALNDYASTLPVSDVTDNPVILASRHNGAEMPVRDKGPLFVIYPFELNPDLYNEVYFGRSVWQVKSISVE